MPLVSVIIPSCNSALFLPDAINSIIQQTYSNWELIIVDDGSTDTIDGVVDPFLVKDNRIKYFKKENGGLGSARNFGIDKAVGEFILPLDADDKFESTFIEKAINIFLNNKKLKIVYCEAEYFGSKEGKWELTDYSYEKMLLSNMIFASSMYRRKDFDNVNGYDESILYEDWDFWLRLLKDGGDVNKIPEILFHYRQHEKGSLMNDLSKKSEKHILSLKTIFDKNKDAFIKIYGNPIEIELNRQKLQRELNNPLHNWITKNRKSIIGRILLKFFK